MKDKPTSIRLPNKTIEDIDNICDGIGCSRNEWIKDTLREGIRTENSQDQEADAVVTAKEEAPKPKIKYEEPRELENVTVESTNVRVVQEQKPVEMILFDGKYIRKGELYET